MTVAAPLPVVLVHGLRTSATMWRAQIEALGPQRTVVALDLPGHGARRGERFTLEGALAAIDAAADAALREAGPGIGRRVVVVGLSLGGYLSVGWAARHPDRVAGVLAAGCSAQPGGPLTSAWAALSRLIAASPDRGAWLNRRAVALAVPEPGATDLGAGGFALDVMVDSLTEIGSMDFRADLSALRCPTWVVNGQWDHFRLGERVTRRIAPQVRFVLVPRATHLVSLVQPSAFNRVLLEALAAIDGSVGEPAGRSNAPR